MFEDKDSFPSLAVFLAETEMVLLVVALYSQSFEEGP